jgi:hypothetical protein
MASIVVAGDTSGTVTLTAPAVSGTTTLTLPTTSGTVLTSASTITPSAGTVTQASLSTNVAGNGPAFSAYPSGTLSISNNTNTKILFQTEEFDTNNNFASSTFTPTVAGYYQLSTLVGTTAVITSEAIISIYKNGSLYKYLANPYASSISMLGGSCLVYANGTTDYFEVYMVQYSGSSRTISSNSQVVWFQGAMVRSA